MSKELRAHRRCLRGPDSVPRTAHHTPHTAASFHILVVSGRGRGQDRLLAPNGQLGVPWG